jgi:hypothetical protein
MGKFKYWVNTGPKQVVHNTIANEGHVAALAALLEATGGAGDLYIGLIDSAVGGPSRFQTLADKDWTEFTNYTEATRQVWNRDTVDGQSVPNQECVPTVFTMAADIQLQGFFITTTNVKGDTTGAFLCYSDTAPTLLYQHDRLFIEYTWEF